MGCFLGCFGLSSNRKRRKPTRKILPGVQRICSYEPLHSSDPTNLHVTENISNSNLRCEEAKKKETKTRKRVRFNLNVQTYEPLPRAYESTCSDEDKEEGRVEVSAPKEKQKDLGMKSSYPSNYRYQNCVDSYEDEDETAYGESDLEDEDYYTEDEIDYQDDADDEDEEEEEDEQLYRSQYVTQVLNPVQNVAQWKAVKAKPVKVKQPRKENVEAGKHDLVKPLLQEIAIDASLSNWLASPKCFNENVSSKRHLLERSPILDITNLGNR